jgi:hypothetical protein
MNPPSLHLTVSAGNIPFVDDFISDLKASVKKLKIQFFRRVTHKIRNKILNKTVMLLPQRLLKKFGNKAFANINNRKTEKENSATMYGMMGVLSGSETLREMILNFLDNVYKSGDA